MSNIKKNINSDETPKNLFEEFPPITTQEWEEKIKIDLKGANYEKKLVWKTLEGFDVKPYYRDENLNDKEHLETEPDQFPFVRGNKTNSNDWLIRQNISTLDVAGANKKALDILMKGVNSLCFNTNNGSIKSQTDFDRLLKDIKIDAVDTNFLSGTSSVDNLSMLENHVKNNGYDKEKILGSLDFDPIRFLTLKGNFYYESEERAFERAAKILKSSINSLPNFKVMAVNGRYFHNSGANIVQEVAFSLAIGTEYLDKMTDLNFTIDEIAPRMHFNFAVGSNYFMEIAKLRAVRMLWATIVDAYKPKSENVAKMFINTVTSDWNKTIYDPHVNMLRSTTEAMSAAIAGADSLTIKTFDSCFNKPNDFSERIARNTQILLKEEAYLDKIVDISAGSYYIEELTNSIAEAAWKLFKTVEDKGGYLSAFKQEFIQDEIEKIAKERNMRMAQRKDNLLGTNQFPNLEEFAANTIDPTVKDKNSNPPKKTIGRSLVLYRGAEAFEELRLATEKAASRPKVFLFTYGNLGMRKARATFAYNFFACAGFEVIDNLGFKTIDEGIQASIDSKAEIVVICSSDDEYVEIVQSAYQQLRSNATVVIAGYPKDCMDELKSIGIKHFIHVKSNVLEELKKFQSIVI